MRLAPLLLCAAVAFAPPTAGQGYDEALRHLAEERYAEALTSADAEADAYRRASARLRIFRQANDMASSRREVRAALEEWPEDLDLLWWKASTDLWARDANGAEEAISRIDAALGGASLEEATRAEWEALLAGWQEQAATLREGERRADGARGRSKAFSLGALAAAVLAFLWVGLRRPAGVRGY